jgi:hypothetical protein
MAAATTLFEFRPEPAERRAQPGDQTSAHRILSRRSGRMSLHLGQEVDDPPDNTNKSNALRVSSFIPDGFSLRPVQDGRHGFSISEASAGPLVRNVDCESSRILLTMPECPVGGP